MYGCPRQRAALPSRRWTRSRSRRSTRSGSPRWSTTAATCCCPTSAWYGGGGSRARAGRHRPCRRSSPAVARHGTCCAPSTGSRRWSRSTTTAQRAGSCSTPAPAGTAWSTTSTGSAFRATGSRPWCSATVTWTTSWGWRGWPGESGGVTCRSCCTPRPGPDGGWCPPAGRWSYRRSAAERWRERASPWSRTDVRRSCSTIDCS